MAKVYNIMDRLTNDKPVIKIDNEHEYTVNNSKNQAIFIKQLSDDEKLDDFEKIDKIIEASLGKEALDYINSLKLSVKATNTIINTIMAALNEVELEEIEQEAVKQAKGFRKR
ncbi:hypothetical protein SAMN02745163_03753 [Clostridium cavendishii DSM 21758]|uniref:Phage XkdN-like tail assembly chaperone protein, TAC n=1 Tax=Clostridium cavendishii DSM 21758 TaxID=1121302 RepID=A0A1M6S5B8_9CLOT|nr:hypothetical protein [Clostridium cavendishii]SHK39718.1 hypothetical protein SAMN02745163_03753 [Clostridium cavendishii DSM 21758]